MKKLLLVLALLVGVLQPSYSQAGSRVLRVGDKAPEITFDVSYSEGYAIPEGKPIILDFWATWCSPCVLGLIKTNEWVEMYSDKIDFVAITDSSSEAIDEFIKRREMRHVYVVDNSRKTHEAFGVGALPDLFVIDRDGIIRWRGHASQLTPEMVDEFLATGSLPESRVQELRAELSGENAAAKDDAHVLRLTIKELQGKAGPSNTSWDLSNGYLEYKSRGSLKSMLQGLDGERERTVWRNMPRSAEERNLSVDFSGPLSDAESVTAALRQTMAASFGVKIYTEVVDTTAWVMSVSDPAKLEAHIGVMYAEFGNLGGNFKPGDYQNIGLFDLAVYLGKPGILDRIIVPAADSEKRYDIKFSDYKNKEQTIKELREIYGLRLKKVKTKVEFLVIDGSAAR